MPVARTYKINKSLRPDKRIFMTPPIRKFFAVILLILLIGVPFINWKLGAVFWMCAWLIFIFQNLFSRHSWKLPQEEDDGEEPD
jgi:hypothetical protein